MLRRLYRLVRKSHIDRTKKYWEKAAKKPLEEDMELICDGFDKNTFENKKESIITKIPLSKDKIILDLAALTELEIENSFKDFEIEMEQVPAYCQIKAKKTI